VGLLLGKNPLEVGSGKIGATNTLRAAGPMAAVAVAILDLLKGALAVLAARFFSWPNDAWLGMAMGCSAASAVVGHNWSVWVRLYTGRWGGGRGIVTAMGAMLIISPWVVAVVILVGALTVVVTRYVAMGAIAGALAGLASILALGAAGALSPWLLPGAAACCLLVILGFHDNIGRLVNGTETRLGSGP
jgi:glycerol-3-phosphate acyltransferase PlsY